MAPATALKPTSTPNQPSPTATPSAVPTDIIAPTADPTLTATFTPTASPAPTQTPDQVTASPGMIMIPGGHFTMGATASDLLAECEQFRSGCRAGWFEPAEPVHKVVLSAYFIDSHEVTNAAFKAFLEALAPWRSCLGHECFNPADSQIEITADGSYHLRPGLSNFPVAGVSWYGAAAYCRWRRARLPTEAEWEMAAAWDPDHRMKTLYPWGDAFDGERVNYCDSRCPEPQADTDSNDGYVFSAPVGRYADGRSPLGASDMAGNLWEWVGDWFDPAYYSESPVTDPTGPEEGTQRVVRGGSWFDTGNFTSTVIRFSAPPDATDDTVGFRCAANARTGF